MSGKEKSVQCEEDFYFFSTQQNDPQIKGIALGCREDPVNEVVQSDCNLLGVLQKASTDCIGL